MNKKIILGIIGIGIFCLTITPWIASELRIIFNIPNPAPCLGCDFLTAWYRFYGMFLPSILVIGTGILFGFREIIKLNRK